MTAQPPGATQGKPRHSRNFLIVRARRDPCSAAQQFVFPPRLERTAMSTHAVVWIDHQEARIFRYTPAELAESAVTAPLHHIHNRHPHHDAKPFFHDVVGAIGDSTEILIVGPAKAKLELIRFIHAHARALEPLIVGVETVDHPTDRQLIAYAKTYFHRVDAVRAVMS